MRIDLHTHSTASDGTDTPAQLVRAAADAGLDVVAITDHDTTGGWDEALAARPPGLTVLRGSSLILKGSELSAQPLSLMPYTRTIINKSTRRRWGKGGDVRSIRGPQSRPS